MGLSGKAQKWQELGHMANVQMTFRVLAVLGGGIKARVIFGPGMECTVTNRAWKY